MYSLELLLPPPPLLGRGTADELKRVLPLSVIVVILQNEFGSFNPLEQDHLHITG
jgi:hypothetical protein